VAVAADAIGRAGQQCAAAGGALAAREALLAPVTAEDRLRLLGGFATKFFDASEVGESVRELQCELDKARRQLANVPAWCGLYAYPVRKMREAARWEAEKHRDAMPGWIRDQERTVRDLRKRLRQGVFVRGRNAGKPLTLQRREQIVHQLEREKGHLVDLRQREERLWDPDPLVALGYFVRVHRAPEVSA